MCLPLRLLVSMIPIAPPNTRLCTHRVLDRVQEDLCAPQPQVEEEEGRVRERQGGGGDEDAVGAAPAAAGVGGGGARVRRVQSHLAAQAAHHEARARGGNGVPPVRPPTPPSPPPTAESHDMQPASSKKRQIRIRGDSGRGGVEERGVCVSRAAVQQKDETHGAALAVPGTGPHPCG